MRRLLLVLAAGVVVIAVALGVVYVLTDNGAHRARIGAASSESVKIPGEGGTLLAARVVTPSGAGKHPLLVMPASWGVGAEEYRVIGPRLAARGYVVVSYAQRGFGDSHGLIDFAGAQTQRDVSEVITWALSHTSADPNAIGALGISYGAGMSLLAAERDPRIKAVVAMSAWSDLGASFYPNNTPSEQAVDSLFAAGSTRRHLDADISAFANQFLTRQTVAAAETLLPLVPSRSAITDVAALNKNGPAVMIANNYQDAYFPPSQIVSLFQKLTGPKRLQLSVGDHGGAESPGLQGQTDKVWDDATAWLDHYLKGEDNGIQTQNAIQLEDASTGERHSYPTWAAATGKSDTLYLTGPGANTDDVATGALANAAATGWTQKITAGKVSAAKAPPIQIGVGPSYKLTRGVSVSAISRAAAGVWQATSGEQAQVIAGSPSVHLTVTPSARNATLVVYLFDVDAAGSGSLITYKPYSLVQATAGAAKTIDVALEPIAWTVAAGHHLGLVIDTVDARFQSLSTAGSTLTFGSPAKSPATLTVPLG